ncbi:tetratricopeptide repeat protein [Microbulbifer sp. TRSA005]|uniref:tetratricopeptide repeat protein n=1 Tax=unclassified Microbulbifer TaxID=2619833 RepID=UPI00403914B5
MRNGRIGIVLITLLVLISPVSIAAEFFSEATEAFKQGKYRRALKYFEIERESGNNSAKLRYNIGVTLMKLERYSEATIYFLGLLNNARWKDLARYNLAIAAERSDRELVALKHYRIVRAGAATEKLRGMAARRLRLLAEDHRGEREKPWLATVSLTVGNDDNAYALQNELLEEASIGDDNYAELFAWGQYRLKGTAGSGWRVQGYGFGRKYKEYDNLDLASARAGLFHDRRLFGWTAEMGFAVEMVTLGGEPVTQQARLLGKVSGNWGRSRIVFSYSPGYYFGGDDYAYLDGWRQYFDLSWQRSLFSTEAKLFYRFDYNDREGQEKAEGDYYSYSPARHTLGGTLVWIPSPRWNISTGVEYRSSLYNESNRITDSQGDVDLYFRESDRMRSWLGAKLRITPNLHVNGKYQYIENEENREFYTYDKSEYSLGVGYSF